MFKRILEIVLIAWAAMFIAAAHAQTPQQDAVNLAELIRTENLITGQLDIELGELDSPSSIILARDAAMSAVEGSRIDSHSDALSTYIKIAAKLGSPRDRLIGDILQNVKRLHKSRSGDKEVGEAAKYLEVYTQHQDWFVAHRAEVLLAILHADSRNYSYALNRAEAAIKLIPLTQDPYALEAKAESYELMTFLHGSLHNLEGVVKAAADEVAAKRAAGLPIDGLSIITNLMSAFMTWEDADTSAELAVILEDMADQVPNVIPGLIEMRLARAADMIGNYDAALIYTQRGLAVANIASVQNSLLGYKAIALAGLGRTQDARIILADLNTKIGRTHHAISAELLLAVSAGDLEAIKRLSDERVRERMQTTLGFHNADSARFLAALDNEKARQAERERALRIQLEQREKINQLLTIIAGILISLALFLALLAAMRKSVIKEIALLKRRADSADEHKRQFLAMVSHELRTPLNGVIGLAELQAHIAPDPDLRIHNQIILESGHDLLSMIEGMLSMSQIESRQLDPAWEACDLREMVATIDQVWRQTIERADANGQRRVRFTTHVDAGVPDYILTDPVRLREAVNHIVSNAAKFTEVGRVHMHVKCGELDGIGETVDIIVADTGIGMDDTMIGTLFTPFVQADVSMTRKYGGAGLGLAITHTIIELLGGDVRVATKPGRGSEFVISIPREVTRAGAGRRGNDDAHLRLTDRERLMVTKAAKPSIYWRPEKRPLTAQEILSGQAAETTLPTIITDAIAKGQARMAEMRGEVPSAPEVRKSLAPQTVAPQTAASRNMPQPVPNTSAETTQPLRILIADDVPTNREVLGMHLAPLGHRVTYVGDGQDALDALTREPYDVVLMDVFMPGLDGVQATRAIRAGQCGPAAREAIIIALTADGSPALNAKALQSGVDVFLTKPIKLAELSDALAYAGRVIAGRCAAPELARTA